MKDDSLYGRIEEFILQSSMTEEEKQNALQVILQNKNRKANILITGATGVGKSSTINALFKMEQAKVGWLEPETRTIQRFNLGDLTLWDSPGLGDGEADKQHKNGIIAKLNERDENGDLLIDVVLVIINGSNRDMGTSYDLINNVIIPRLDNKRLLVGINKADAALDREYWDRENSQPLPKLQEFLNEKAASVQRRIHEATGVTVEPVCYSAGFKAEGKEREKPYNLPKLLCYMIERIPPEKRIQVAEQVSQKPAMWASDDGQSDYKERTRTSTGELFIDGLKTAAAGAAAVAVVKISSKVIGGFLKLIGGFFR